MTKNDEKEVNLYDDLDNIDKAIINILLDKPGTPDREVAEKIGVSLQTVYRRRKKHKLQMVISDYQKPVLQILLDAQPDAAREMRRIVKSATATDTDKIRAAKEILKGVLAIRVNVNGSNRDLKRLMGSLTDDDFRHALDQTGIEEEEDEQEES